MAVVEWDSSSKKEPCYLSTSEDVKTTTDGAVPKDLSSIFNPFSQFYCKRIIVQNSNGDGPRVSRTEEAVFICQPNQSAFNSYHQFRGQPYEQFFQPDTNANQSHHRKKRSHSSKPRSHLKPSSKTNSKTHCRHSEKNKVPYTKIAAAVILVCPLLVWQLSTLYWCQPKPLDFLGMESSLKDSVIGQEDGLNSLLLNFYRTSNLNSQPPVFLFSGSTGVGKSFIINQIVDNFPGSGHKEIFFYHTPAPEEVVKKLRSCEQNLLVLDGLYFKDSHEIASWAQRIQKEAALHNKQLWIIFVFTTEHWVSDSTDMSGAEFFQEVSKISNKIEEVFNSYGIATKLITFKPMEIDNVKECVRRELENFGLLADETQLDQIVRQLTSTPTLRQKGCKHVKKYFLHSSNTIGLSKSND